MDRALGDLANALDSRASSAETKIPRLPSGSTSNRVLEDLFDRYQSAQRPLIVNFRSLVEWIGGPDRATHLIHPYPAKLLVQIPAFFLSNDILSKRGDLVLDPFCGSGTVLLEALASGRRAIGIDTNPLARLISVVKVRLISAIRLRRALERILVRIPAESAAPTPNVVNLDYWFYPHVVDKLQRLRDAIDQTRDPFMRDFFRVCFSVCVRRVSLADPRLSVPVRLKMDQYPVGHWLRDRSNARLRALKTKNVFMEFADIARLNIERMERFAAASNQGSAEGIVLDGNARELNAKLPSASVQLVITSPPYIGAQKYIRASSLSIGWLGLEGGRSLRNLEDDNIGREHYPRSDVMTSRETGFQEADGAISNIRQVNPTRAHMATVYLCEMRDSLSEIARVVRPGGYVVLVTGDNLICGQKFKTSYYLTELAKASGLKLKLSMIDCIKSRGLMTRRNRTAGVIANEWVSVFQKEGPANV